MAAYSRSIPPTVASPKMTEPHAGRGLPGHTSLQTLRRQLRDAEPPYILISPLQKQQARFYFSGPFEGQEIIWDATLMTLEHYVQEACRTGEYRAGEAVELQQFIDISDETISPLPIKIVHDIPFVDSGRILKTVIMIRNYKRLHRGRHPYGPTHNFIIESREL